MAVRQVQLAGRVAAGELCEYVTEVKSLVPRALWRQPLVGLSPDGINRVAWSIGRPSAGDEGAGSGVLRRRRQQASRCSVFVVDDYSSRGSLKLVLLAADGRAAYSGDLAPLHGAVATAVASRKVPFESSLDLSYAGHAWRSDCRMRNALIGHGGYDVPFSLMREPSISVSP
jgi:hypothetical protein